MNKFYLISIIGIFFNATYSQSNLIGQVLSANAPLSNVEIINSAKKDVAKSDEKGEFQIQAELNDEIVFFLKGYIQKSIKVTTDYLNKSNKIFLDKQVIELEEIKIIKAPKVTIINSYESLKEAKISKEQLRPKVVGVNTGEFQNGVDFIAIGNKLSKLVKKVIKSNDSRKKEVQTSFEECINKYFDDKTLIETLRLSEDNFKLFIEFCKNDLNVKNVITNNNELDVLEFLLKKRKEFKFE